MCVADVRTIADCSLQRSVCNSNKDIIVIIIIIIIIIRIVWKSDVQIGNCLLTLVKLK